MTTTTRSTFQPDYASPPGETLLEALDEAGMSQAELADRTGRSKKTINEIIQGKAPITPESALQFERVLHIPAAFWNQREREYREALARLEDEKRLRGWADWLKTLPLATMIRRGWITKYSDSADQVRELLRYFSVASPEAWRAIWEQEVVAYRKSAAVDSEFGPVAVWLRQGELEAQDIICAPYDAKEFRAVLSHIRNLTVEPSETFVPALVDTCARVGVAVVFVQGLPKTGICGATRWLTSEKALLQLSLRYKTDDHLWFTFFHESAHILLHGKRDVFLEPEPSARVYGQASEDTITLKESEADQFAAEFLIPSGKWRSFVGSGNYRSKASVLQFAGAVGISPGIVVGRLQHERLLPFTHCNELKRRLTWIDEAEDT